MPKGTTSTEIEVKAQLQVRLDEDLRSQLERFCRATKRQPVDTVRHIIELFLAEGDGVASQRLNEGLWAAAESGDVDVNAFVEELRAVLLRATHVPKSKGKAKAG